MKNVLDTITSYREARHWSNYDLASHAGIKPTTISSWYRKNIVPTVPTLLKICDAFGITLTEFFSVALNPANGKLLYLLMNRQKCLKNGLRCVQSKKKQSFIC